MTTQSTADTIARFKESIRRPRSRGPGRRRPRRLPDGVGTAHARRHGVRRQGRDFHHPGERHLGGQPTRDAWDAWDATMCQPSASRAGSAVDAHAGIALIRAAVDVGIGITFLDTAQVYRPFTTEQLVGKPFAPVREQVAIATKFGFRFDDERRTGLRHLLGPPRPPSNGRGGGRGGFVC
ncbi:aldo/keto reductase [Actinopolymorpha pittospori]